MSYLKSLLVLALCFHAHYAGNSVRIYDKIHGGLEMGKVLKVEVYDPESYPEFIINLYTSSNLAREVSNIGLSLKVNVTATRGEMVVNSMVDGIWRKSITLPLLKIIEPRSVLLRIVAEESFFNIVIFGQQQTWKYVVPAESLHFWEIQYRREYAVMSTIWYRKYAPCGTCTSSIICDQLSRNTYN